MMKIRKKKYFQHSDGDSLLPTVVKVMDNLWLPGSLKSFHVSTVVVSADTHCHVVRVGTGT